MNTQQNKNAPVLVALIVGVAAAGAGFFVLMAGSGSASVEAPAPAVVVKQAQPVSMPAPVPQPSAPSSDPSVEPVGVEPTREPPSTASRLARDLEREKIWAALRREHNLKPAAPGSPAPTESAAALLPTLDPQYVREAVREQLVPVAQDCYNTVLTKQDAEAGGELIMKFTIVAVEEIGGVVEEAEIDEASTLDNEFMHECIRESLMAVTFEPPTDGGRVEVTYPINFSPD
ncbi:MAG TPA: AgmX/PglI C-terminal domain-containing protein [Enhygromyxa sp.]|nr:AgmX/PglI C-terminal domain-containing protein [Enhygromyxa sp.]